LRRSGSTYTEPELRRSGSTYVRQTENEDSISEQDDGSTVKNYYKTEAAIAARFFEKDKKLKIVRLDLVMSCFQETLKTPDQLGGNC